MRIRNPEAVNEVPVLVVVMFSLKPPEEQPAITAPMMSSRPAHPSPLSVRALLCCRNPGLPGGGAFAMRRLVPDVVSNQQQLLTLPRTTLVRDAAKAMRERHVGAVLVSVDGRLEGIFTERDMVNRVVAEGRDLDRTTLADVMTANPDTASPNDTAIAALRRMQDGGYRHLPIVDRGRLVGIVSRRDFHGEEKARLDEESGLWAKIG
jgi:CBS domain-containing protein